MLIGAKYFIRDPCCFDWSAVKEEVWKGLFFFKALTFFATDRLYQLFERAKTKLSISDPESLAMTGHFTLNMKKMFSGLSLKDS